MLPMIYMALVDDEDISAFEEMYNKYKQPLFHIAFSILNNKHDAEDAVQEAFIKIADSFTDVLQIPCNELNSFLVIICRNAAINIYNKNKRIAEHSTGLDERIAAEDVMLIAEDKDTLMASLSRLPQEYKDVLFLYDLRGYSAKETAQLLNLSEINVRVRVFRARKMLKDILIGGDCHD